MSTPSDPGRSNAEDQPDVGAEAATEMFAPAEDRQGDERRFTAPSAFDGSTQIIGHAPTDPATEIIDMPEAGAPETAAARAATPQTIPARGEQPDVPPHRRRSWGWVIAVVLVIAALVAVAILVTVLLTRGSAQSQRDQVRRTIETYDAAVRDGDLAALRGVTCAGFKHLGDFDDEQWQELHTRIVDAKQEPIVASIDEVVVDGDHAEANVTAYLASDPNTTSTRSFDLQRHDGQWKIC